MTVITVPSAGCSALLPFGYEADVSVLQFTSISLYGLLLLGSLTTAITLRYKKRLAQHGDVVAGTRHGPLCFAQCLLWHLVSRWAVARYTIRWCRLCMNGRRVVPHA